MLKFFFRSLQYVIILQLSYGCGSKKLVADKALKEPLVRNFLQTEFNYTSFLNQADYSAEKHVPFQDFSNDTYFRVGLIEKSQLVNYTKIRMEDYLGSLKNKPWLPINKVREEFANCAMLKYGSISENDFKYDKGMYGWINLMKFSCFWINDHFIAFVMSFARTRFRLKQVYLKRQNTYWATSGRSLITRDVQKITELFSIRFSYFVQQQISESISKYATLWDRRKHEINVLNIKNDTFDELAVMYGRLKKHAKLSQSRGPSFNAMAVGIKNRIMLLDTNEASHVIEAVSDELSDNALVTIDSCTRETCSFRNLKNTTFNSRTKTYHFSMQNSFIHTVANKYSLIAYQTAKPYFIFETMKRKLSTKIIEIKQRYDDKVESIWTSFLEQQFALAMHLHNSYFFSYENYN